MGANEALIEGAYEDRTRLADPEVVRAVLETIEQLDQGTVRVASPPQADGATSESPGAPHAEWTVHAWVKKAILLYFGLRKIDVMRAGDLEFFDKIPVKSNLAAGGVRIVPPGVVRYGAFLEPGAIVMPGYVNIGAYVGSGSMVDTWATVGSCAQIGKDVHLAGGVGIGGVLEPPGARPVIIEDGAFIGSRVVIVEGMHVGKEAVIGAGVVLTASTTILDVTGSSPVETKGHIPARSVVIPGTRTKKFPAGEFQVPCALIIGTRTESTDRKTSLNAALRDFAVPC